MHRISKKQGFTLVELLIVVAIIGVLATVAIPTYKKMVAKARKSEAQAMLGAITKAESAFVSEWGAYGTNLAKIGIDTELPDGIYSYGFFRTSAACVADTIKPVNDAANNPYGPKINERFPDYFNETTAETGVTITGMTNCYVPPTVSPDNGSSFIASANGPIFPGIQVNAALTEHDIWTINQNRLLVNVQDGVK